MKRNTTRYRLLLAVHKYLGLATGIIVLLVSLTGAAWVFRDEIEPLFEPAYAFDVAAADVLPASRARELGRAIYPDRAVHGTLYADPGQPVEVIFYQLEPEFYRSALLHPTTGELLHIKDHRAGFFPWLLRGHMYLWLPPDIGGPLVRYGVLVFLLILLSGLLIWLPGRVKHLRRNLSFRWKPTTGWRRKNFDLHGIGGTYVAVFGLLFAVTGSAIGLPWFYQGMYRALGGDGDPSFVIPGNVSAAPATTAMATEPFDLLVPRLRVENPTARNFEIHYPHDGEASVYVEISRDEGTYWRNDYRFFDRYTLEEIPSPSVYAKYGDADFARLVMRMNYDVHVGAIGGIPGKVIALLASLVVASLPVTGFLLWLGRRKKGRRSPVQARARTRVPEHVG
ncbi:PepSY-associated TM helix domain-containing protein [Lewinella sp. IMCC34183]|uniref:PepSY-associated TM helix domain-containing protein n=1 Tax=Lewinella sp. IMCC34183 TaxID=2248762 RepID=UPI000E25C410|nr:PepSY-associated TM helix domain-containing protein [Lewinella sp. IMCC34183]